jgi:anti-sigma factor RsiW
MPEMMDNAHETERLSEYLDGGLSAGERAAVALHLAECSECAGLLEELRAVVTEAAALPAVSPARDLWPGIAGRLKPRRAAEPVAARQAGSTASPTIRLWSRRRLMVTVPQLLAAGLAVGVLSAAGAWAALGGPAGTSTRAGPGVSAAVTTAPPTDVVLAAYQPGMAELEAEYQRRRDELDPETIRVVERSLAIIDAAILEASEALAADPSSGFLNGRLADAVRIRMTLLRQASSI